MYPMRYRGGYWRGPRPFGPFMLLPLLFLFACGLFTLKFFWPLLLIVGVFVLFGSMFRHHNGGSYRRYWGGDWSEKRKNDWDEKPKHDDQRRYTQTADGDWVEIV